MISDWKFDKIRKFMDFSAENTMWRQEIVCIQTTTEKYN